MSGDGPSRTAINVAIYRAAHLLMDAEPKILRDDFARHLAGFSSDEELLAEFRKRSPGFQANRTLFVLRHRYVEDELARAVDRGTLQYVILGAGLDSFAYRSSAKFPELRIFEVDSPSTQTWKRKRLDDLGLTAPARLRYVSGDLETRLPGGALTEAGLKGGEPAFFSSLGLTQYLTKEGNAAMLRDIARTAGPESEAVVQFQPSPGSLRGDDGKLLTAFAAAAAAAGEPWLSFYEPGEMEETLRRAGFDDVRAISVEEASGRYLADRRDGLALPAHFAMVRATLAPR